MEYVLVKAINNNVVLVREPGTQEQLVLMSKGIGFGGRPGGKISDDRGGEEVIKFLNNSGQISSRIYDNEEIKSVVRTIASSAEKKLAIKNKNFYPALFDHICFAINRVQFGVPIENPFINEISVFYSDEYGEAQKAVITVKEKLGINLGSGEAGFIALHFHSAKSNTPVSASLKDIRILNEIVKIIFKDDRQLLSKNSPAVRAFVLSASSIINFSGGHHPFSMPPECGIAAALPESRAVAESINGMVLNEKGRALSQGDMDFLTVAVEQLRQQLPDGG
ncbi:MAG TPA: hypothetical protein DIV41_08465 [Ruminococcaceae bacterium]|nr:hypothetical protein [Oscillospiraceae bacterium]